MPHSSGRGRSDESQRVRGRIEVKGREKAGGPAVTASRPPATPHRAAPPRSGPPASRLRAAAGTAPGCSQAAGPRGAGLWPRLTPHVSSEAGLPAPAVETPGRSPAHCRAGTCRSRAGSHLQRTRLHFREPFRGLPTSFPKETHRQTAGNFRNAAGTGGKELHSQTPGIPNDTYGVYFFVATVIILPRVKCLIADIKKKSPPPFFLIQSFCYIPLHIY